MYNGHSEDLRHSLRHVLEAEAEFQQKLQALNNHADPLEKRRFAESLEDATDALQGSTEARAPCWPASLRKRERRRTSKNGLVRKIRKPRRGRHPRTRARGRAAKPGRTGAAQHGGRGF